MTTNSLDVLGGATSGGSASTDVLTGVSNGAGCKAPCAAATTSNRTLSGLLVVDGYQTVAGDRILVRAQTDTTQNGIWNASAGAWTRAIDCDGAGDLYKGTIVTVGNGTTYANVIFVVSTANPITVSVTPLSFTAYMFNPASYVNADGSVPFTATLKLSAGALTRWQWSRVNTETGSNAGSDLELHSFADNGSSDLGYVWKAVRSSRVLDLFALPTVGGTTLTSNLPAFVASGASHAKGIVPDPGATAGVTKFLREDSSFAVPVARGGASALKITNNAGTPNTKIDITARSLTIGNAATGLVYVANPSFTIDLTTNQVANGIAEATTKQISTWYYLYAIAKIDGSGTTAALATSIAPPTAPTLPTGYTAYEYIGAVYVFSDGFLRRTLQLGDRSQYQITAGSANTTTAPSSTSAGSISLTTFLPATATQVFAVLQMTSAAATPQYCVAAPSSAWSIAYAPIAVNYDGGTIASAQSASAWMVLEAQSVFVTRSAGNSTLWILGWKDSVNAS